MRFRKLLICNLLVATLAACSSTNTIVYSLELHAPDEGKAMELVQATERVMTRRLAAAQVKNPIVTTVPSGSDAGTLSFKLPDAEAIKTAERIVGEPFAFEMRIEKNPSVTPSEADDNWEKTDLNGSSVVWTQAIGNRTTGEISVEILLTPDGQKMYADILKRSSGKSLGVFVRGLLVSKLKVSGTATPDRITIGGVPSARIAEVFVDDMNVGLRVTFTQH